MQHISLVAAMAKHNVIGKDGDMPWHLPSELQYFKEVTLGKPIVMGRTTFESIGRPLPGRRNVVITRNPDALPAGVEGVSSPQAALELLQDVAEIMIIGGGQIYNYFLPLATRLYLTHIDLDVPGDTFFPKWNSELWSGHCLREQAAQQDEPGFSAYLYEKST